jgi:hypothetical protein
MSARRRKLALRIMSDRGISRSTRRPCLRLRPKQRHHARRLPSIRRRSCSTRMGQRAGWHVTSQGGLSLGFGADWRPRGHGQWELPRTVRLSASGGWPVCGRVALRTPRSPRSTRLPSAVRYGGRVAASGHSMKAVPICTPAASSARVAAFQALDRELQERVAPPEKASRSLPAGARQPSCAPCVAKASKTQHDAQE